MFLFAVICACTRTRSATFPVNSGNLERKSTSMQWLSVPPDIMLYPMSTKALAMAAAFDFTFF